MNEPKKKNSWKLIQVAPLLFLGKYKGKPEFEEHSKYDTKGQEEWVKIWGA